MHYFYLFCPPAEASQECQHQGTQASGARKACHTAAKHSKNRQTQHQEGTLHHQVFLEEIVNSRFLDSEKDYNMHYLTNNSSKVYKKSFAKKLGRVGSQHFHF